MAMQTPFSPLLFGKSFMKIRSGMVVWYFCGERKKNKKNICKTYTHLPHWRLRKKFHVAVQITLTADDFSLYNINVSSFRAAHMFFHDRSLILCHKQTNIHKSYRHHHHHHPHVCLKEVVRCNHTQLYCPYIWQLTNNYKPRLHLIQYLHSYTVHRPLVRVSTIRTRKSAFTFQ